MKDMKKEGERALSDKSQQKEVKGWRRDYTLPREILASESITDI